LVVSILLLFLVSSGLVLQVLGSVWVPEQVVVSSDVATTTLRVTAGRDGVRTRTLRVGGTFDTVTVFRRSVDRDWIRVRGIRRPPLESVARKVVVHFGSDCSAVQSRARRWLRDWVGDLPHATTARVLGHTDDVGEASDNVVLSRERARSVATALRREGMAVSTWNWYGEEQPVALNLVDGVPDLAGRRANRRAEVVPSLPYGLDATGGPKHLWANPAGPCM
jgi:outer membrane protein OmpA-like peptidoglycan-associated protein